jgi:hypothetical protein
MIPLIRIPRGWTKRIETSQATVRVRLCRSSYPFNCKPAFRKLSCRVAQEFSPRSFLDCDVLSVATIARRTFGSCSAQNPYERSFRAGSPPRALERFPGRTLAAPAELAQNAPDVVLVIAHPGAVRDEITHPSCGPQDASIAARLGPALERVLEVAQLRRVELCWTAGASRFAQRIMCIASYTAIVRPAARKSRKLCLAPTRRLIAR